MKHAMHRIRLFYAAYFAAMGLILPFFPVYLDGQGLGTAMVGFFTGLLALAKVLAPPWVGHALDARPDIRLHRFIALASLLAACSAMAISLSLNLYMLGMTILLFGVFWAVILPLTDGLAMSVSEAGCADYGRLRAWGSAGFVLASLAGGIWLAGPAIQVLPLVLTLLMLVLAAAALGFPTVAAEHHRDGAHQAFSRSFYLLLGIAFFMQLSHGAYYGFFSLYLADAGYSGWQIGLYWGLGVLAEIVLMWGWSRRMQNHAPARLFSICLLLAGLRWLGTGWSTEPVLLATLQLLHAASFAAFHVAAVAWVKRLAPKQRHSAAQGFYSAAGFGLGSSIGIMGCGLVADAYGYQMSFYICAGIALLGIPLARMLPKQPSGACRT